MIRRARTGNTKVKLSVWDRKDTCWISANEAEKRNTPLKSLHLNNLPDEKDDDASAKSEESEESEEDDEDGEEGDGDVVRKRKARGVPDERLIEVKKWVVMAPGVAEKIPERSFLAKRREGMPALYAQEYARKVFGRYHSSSVISGSSGYEQEIANVVVETPRKNVPPRRKKKKLGGPGRKKANPVVVQQSDGVVEMEVEAKEVKVEGEGEESGSEGEGSEEGEIDESGKEKDVVVQTVAEVLGETGNSDAPGNADGVGEAEKSEKVETGEDGEIGESREVEMRDVEGTVDQKVEDETVRDERKESIVTVPSPKMPESPGLVVSGSVAEFIPGLGAFEDEKRDPEEREIIEENARAIALTDDPGNEQIVGVSEAIADAVASKEPIEETGEKTDQVVEKAEVDLLGAMDAAIDQGMQGDEK